MAVKEVKFSAAAREKLACRATASNTRKALSGNLRDSFMHKLSL